MNWNFKYIYIYSYISVFILVQILTLVIGPLVQYCVFFNGVPLVWGLEECCLGA